MKRTTRRRRLVLAASVALLGVLAACGSNSGGSAAGTKKTSDVVIGVSNTLVGNGWRDEMICSIKAQALVSGKVSKLIIANENANATKQIADLRNLISQGVNAIILDPVDPAKLNPVIEEAEQKGIVVVAVDQSVTASGAYLVSNNQTAYGQLGAEWLAKQLGGKGNVAEMRGTAGAAADTDRQNGFMQVMKQHPGIHVVQQVYTNWDFSTASQEAHNILGSSTKVNGIWTSGTDYTVVNALQTLHKPYIPVVGADTNEFIHQMLTLAGKGFVGAAVTNPPAVGGAGVAVALKVLKGQSVPKVTQIKPEVWTVATAKAKLQSVYNQNLAPTDSVEQQIPGYTTYTQAQVQACKGPGGS